MASSRILMLGVLFVAVFAAWQTRVQAQDSCQMDLTFVLDTSGSMKDNYTLCKNFMQNIVETWPIGPTGVQVSTYIVGNNAVNKIPLDNTFDKTALKSEIAALPFQMQKTNTQQSPQKVLDEFNAKGRPGVKKATIFCVDGEKTHPDIERDFPLSHESEGPKLKNNGVDVVFITLSGYYNAGLMDRARHQLYVNELSKFLEKDTFATLPTDGPAEVNSLLQYNAASCLSGAASSTTTTAGPTGPITLDIQPPVLSPTPMPVTFTCSYSGAVPEGTTVVGLDISKTNPLQTMYKAGASTRVVDPLFATRVTETKPPNTIDYQVVVTLDAANWCTDVGEYRCYVSDPLSGASEEGTDTLEAMREKPFLTLNGQIVADGSQHTLAPGEHTVDCETQWKDPDFHVALDDGDKQPGKSLNGDCTHVAKASTVYTLEEGGTKTFSCVASYNGVELPPVTTTINTASATTTTGGNIVPTMTTGAAGIELSVYGMLLTVLCFLQMLYNTA